MATTFGDLRRSCDIGSISTFNTRDVLTNMISLDWTQWTAVDRPELQWKSVFSMCRRLLVSQRAAGGIQLSSFVVAPNRVENAPHQTAATPGDSADRNRRANDTSPSGRARERQAQSRQVRTTSRRCIPHPTLRILYSCWRHDAAANIRRSVTIIVALLARCLWQHWLH